MLDRYFYTTFDDGFPENESLPRHFEAKMIESEESVQLYIDGCLIGNQLTDAAHTTDWYRFHDVFHLANACCLHWSPVFRRMLDRKRRSNPKIDEVEDGGRAIVVEEGLVLWIFLHAREINYFEGCTTIPKQLLADVKKFTQGLEVEVCNDKQWEQAILQGYKAFRQLVKFSGGKIIGNLIDSYIAFEEININ